MAFRASSGACGMQSGIGTAGFILRKDTKLGRQGNSMRMDSIKSRQISNASCKPEK